MTDAASTAGPLEDILGRARRVPPTTTFPTVDELVASFEELRAAHPALVRRRRIGSSRTGEPLHAYAVGDGPRALLLVAGVHPNEPIGLHTVRHLATTLVQDEQLRAEHDATWWFVPCIDPDGTRLNESWFTTPTDRAAYFRGFYRPAPAEQVEWSFPLDHAGFWFDQVLPETQALMRLVDEVRPDLLVSLHNGESGGVYYYLTRELPGAVEALQAIPAALGLPLDDGEPESPLAPVLGTGVFGMIDAGTEIDHMVALGLDPTQVPSGNSSAAYADRYGTLSLVAELPYWTHPACDDRTATTTSYRQVLATKADRLAELGQVLTDALAAAGPHLTWRTPTLRATQAFAPVMVQAALAERARVDDPANDRPATVAEVHSNTEVLHSFRLRFTGMALRALDAELDAGVGPHPLRAVRARLGEQFDAWLAEALATELVPAPLERLVGVQVAATLVMSHLLRTEVQA
ncbi:M14 family zinc carboxypeptidase [Cellulomonas citrea]|uniref:M14 family zinc carboxypeptidase n=1 Tax=Cellulomonas citrea TaxID=1909423 RepID=UPI00135CD721|nr:M14 family zinc carboxypeptidase [Cellulomonas citrea]